MTTNAPRDGATVARITTNSPREGATVARERTNIRRSRGEREKSRSLIGRGESRDPTAAAPYKKNALPRRFSHCLVVVVVGSLDFVCSFFQPVPIFILTVLFGL